MPSSRTRTSLQPRRRPSQQRSRATVEAILEAAARVFAASGYAGATTNHIAGEAGVSVGSLYEYFPNKDAILAALLETHIEAGEAILSGVAETAAGARGAEVAPVVRRFVEAMVALHSQDRALHRVLFEEAPLPRRLRRRIEDIERRAAAYVEAWLRAHPGRTRRDPAVAATVIVQTIEGLTHRWVIHADPARAMDTYVDEIVDLVVAYLGSRRVRRNPVSGR